MIATPLIVEQTYNAPISKVWKAISDKDEMQHWYFDLEEFDPKVGFKFEFTGGPDEGRQYLHLCKVTEVEHEKKLIYSWRYYGYGGNSFVSFELFPIEEGKTLLRLTHTGLETFPKDHPDLAAENFVSGWKHIIQQSLKAYLED